MSAETSKLIVRAATDVDVPQLGRLGTLLVETHHAFDAKRFLPMGNHTRADYGTFLGRQLNNPEVVLLVAEEHGEVIGYAFATVEGYDYLMLRGPAGVLQDIVVDPRSRRRGVATKLLQATLAELASRNLSQVMLFTAERNERARALFERAGFRPTMIEMTREFDK